MEITSRNNSVIIISEKKEVEILPSSIVLDGMNIDFPWEYEKSGFLLAHQELQGKPLFSLRIEGKNIAYIPTDTLEITEEVVDFFGNIDILVLLGNKNSTKIFENLETRIVLPIGEEKTIFLNSLWQNIDPIEKFKTKESDFEWDNVIFLNIG